MLDEDFQRLRNQGILIDVSAWTAWGPFSDASVVCIGFGDLLISHLEQRAARGCGSGHPLSRTAICSVFSAARLASIATSMPRCRETTTETRKVLRPSRMSFEELCMGDRSSSAVYSVLICNGIKPSGGTAICLPAAKTPIAQKGRSGNLQL